MNAPACLILGLGLAALLALPALGATPSSPEEPVRLYTNADLVRIEPAAPAAPRTAAPMAAAAPSYAGERADWEFVSAWLEREYARIDAASRTMMERESYGPVAERPHYGLALAPWASGYGYGYGPGYGCGPGQGHPDWRPHNPPVHPRPLMPLWRPRPLMPLRQTMRPPLSMRR